MAVTPQELLDRIALRKRLIHWARRGYWFTLIFAIIFATVLITLRLLNIVEDPFRGWMVLLVPTVGVLFAAIFHRGISDMQAARLADEHAKTKDLFLTASSLNTSTGDYQDAVTDQANKQAPTVNPSAVVPYFPGKKLGHVVMILLVLTAGILWMPQFDLLGQDEDRQKTTQRKQRLEETRKALVKRSKKLKKQDLLADQSKQVEAKINALQQALRKMKKIDPKGNVKRLADQKQRIQDTWQQKKLAQSLKNKSANQRFGNNTQQQRQWKKQMKNGQSQNLQKKMQAVQKKAEQLAKTTDKKERAKLQKEIKQDIQEMLDYAMKENGAQQLAQSLEQALNQLDMTQMDDISSEAAKALSESMNLSQQELQQLAQSVRDMQKLEEALKAIQQAQLANNLQPLDGESTSSCKTLSDYQKLYDKICQGRCKNPAMCQGQCQGKCQGNSPSMSQGNTPGQGQGAGMKGAGQGQGNIAPEDDSVVTNFKTEKEKTKLRAGKILLKWKTKGMAKTGQAVKDYEKSIHTVKQDAAQAIESEQVPAGYHDAIKKYFDTIEQVENAPQKPSESK